MRRSHFSSLCCLALLTTTACSRPAPPQASFPPDAQVMAVAMPPVAARPDAAQPAGSRDATPSPASPLIDSGAPSAAAAPTGPPTYERVDGKNQQRLWIISQTKKQVRFVLQRSGSCSATLAMTAEGTGESELTADNEEETSYTAVNYLQKTETGCYVSLWIEDGHTKAIFEQKKCELPCPFTDEPMHAPPK